MKQASRLLGVFALMCALPLVAASGRASASEPELNRTILTPVEHALDTRLETAAADDPLDLLGSTRGVYLAGYGAVFTAEADLVLTPHLSPFRKEFTADEIKKLHDRKLRRLPILKQAMSEMALTAAKSLGALPASEQVVVVVRLMYQRWEDTAGLPSQLVIQADRATLMKKAVLDSSIRMEEH
jgi:hypothetical protein